MKIVESQKSEHELINIHTGEGQTLKETWVDIHRDHHGSLLSIHIDNKEISRFDLAILEFLKKEGKL